MDIFAHGIWSGISYKALEGNLKKPASIPLAVFWGIFPDLFAFTIPFVYMFSSLLTGKMTFDQFRPHTELEPVAHTFPFYDLANSLYDLSHSIFIFAAVFIFIAIIKKQAVWELGGWLLHILIDIPTHSYEFFPTPFLWPISDFRVNGFSWGSPTFMFINYSLIIVSIAVIYIYRRKIRNSSV